MQLHYSRLGERDRRHYAALESLKLGRGGITYICKVLGVDRGTVIRGRKELMEDADSSQVAPADSVKAEVAEKTIRDPEIKRLLIALIEEHKAGSPTDSNVYWISLKPWSIARMLWERHQIKLSNGIVKRQLKELGYGYRKQSKQLPTGHYARRDEQFKIICLLVSIMGSQSPVLSIDCKKKEQLGNLYRAGKCYCTQAVNVYDHDYQHLSEGKVIPHGIYDLKANQGYISIGSSGETADFIIDNLLWWWWNYGIHQYPDARNIVLLCDAGGANSYRHHIFKHRLMEFARETGLSVIVCHYPLIAPNGTRSSIVCSARSIKQSREWCLQTTQP